MWNWFSCHVAGRHEFGVWCGSGTIFLRCVHCGRRSSGWAVNDPGHASETAPAGAREPVQPQAASQLPAIGRVVPFARPAPVR
jgi:hypothetical protein